MRLTLELERTARLLRHGFRALTSRDHPVLAHLIAIRRCNLACTYCNEYDTFSRPVALELMLHRIALLAGLRTSAITFSGGEPLLHPQLPEMIAATRAHGLFATLITNGYLLSPALIAGLNRAGLDHLQISIDNVDPDSVSCKSLRLLEPKLRWLKEHAQFSVAINSVLGSGVRNPQDALVVARRARELGFQGSVGIVHDGQGQLRALAPPEKAVYEQIKALQGWRPVRFNRAFQDRLVDGQPNNWRCRAGARFLYVDENGLVHYCSQQRGAPAIPLERYTRQDIRREYATEKPCAPYCTVNCVQQVGMADNWRAPQHPASPTPSGPAIGATPSGLRTAP